eukprot:GDKJ01007989.1.p1 GENE.GDKJ01007989.1~~GDKJ01007989.1.p1  ORF type:complete len:1004 (+),score=276.11 GDKJ01007989.1:159-3014(+)
MNKKRETIKKVILYMTLGVDVSRLFPEMVLASHTTDLVQKKMVYLYISTYAHLNQDLAILAVNTLQKDSRDHDPTIRGLALRSLASLRVGNLVEHLEPVVRAGLRDPNGYVRRAAVMAVLKMRDAAPEVIELGDWKELLYEKLNDADTNVVSTAINTLNEIESEEGGLKISRVMAINLLNRLKSFSEWGQSTVLNVISKFVPQSDDELFDVFNVLEERLKHSSSSVVLSCVNCFLSLTHNRPQLLRQVIVRLRSPLLTLANNPSSEVAWVVLNHILQLLHLRAARQAFADDFKSFYCRFSDPSYIKLVRIQILSRIANPFTASYIISELAESAQDPNRDVSEASFKALGEISISVPSSARQVVTVLGGFLEGSRGEVASGAVEALGEVLMLETAGHLDLFNEVKSSVEALVDALAMGGGTLGVRGISALLSIVGKYCMQIESAPYILESFVDGIENGLQLEGENDLLRIALLSCVVRTFLSRPPESLKLLHRVFKLCLEGVEDRTASPSGDATVSPLVRDRALFYIRLLKSDPTTAKRILLHNNSPSTVVAHSSYKSPIDSCNGVKDLLSEFNSLSVIYNKPAVQFLPSTITPLPLGGTWTGEVPADWGKIRPEEEKEDLIKFPDVVDRSAFAEELENESSALNHALGRHDLLDDAFDAPNNQQPSFTQHQPDDDDDIILPSQQQQVNDTLPAHQPANVVSRLFAPPTAAPPRVPAPVAPTSAQPRNLLDDSPQLNSHPPPASASTLKSGPVDLLEGVHPLPPSTTPPQSSGINLLESPAPGAQPVISSAQQQSQPVINPFGNLSPPAQVPSVPSPLPFVSPHPSPSPVASPLETLVLTAFFPLAPPDFEKGWTTAPCELKGVRNITDLTTFSNLALVKQTLHAANVFVLASRPNKFFAYAREASGKMLLLDLTAKGNVLEIVIKFGPQQATPVAESFMQYLVSTLSNIIA